MTKIIMNTMSATKKSNYIKGSKIPMTFLIDYIAEGYSLSEFISAYPWVKKNNAKKALLDLKTISSNYAL